MICIPCPSANRRCSTGKHMRNSSRDDFLLMIPAIRQHALFSFCKKQLEEKAELVEECVANAFKAYVRLKELGKHDLIYLTVLATYAVRQVRDGRRVGGRLNSSDILSHYAQLRKHIKIERLDRFDVGEEQWCEAVVEDSSTPVPEQAAFRVDFPAWREQHQPAKRAVINTLSLGYSTSEAANRFALSRGRISQLRREFEDSWHEFQGEVVRATRESPT